MIILDMDSSVLRPASRQCSHRRRLGRRVEASCRSLQGTEGAAVLWGRRRLRLTGDIRISGGQEISVCNSFAEEPSFQEKISHLLTRPVGRLLNRALCFYSSFSY
jgi:hypothetical protein